MNAENVDSRKEPPVVIFGAGPAGLTAGRELARRGKRVIVLEKESLVGGISSSERWNGFNVEFGPHTYHVKNDEIDDIIREHYPGELKIKKRVTNMLIRGKYLDYPLKFWQLIRNLNPFFTARMLADFIYSSLKNKISPRPDDSFETWGIKRFGNTLYQLCFGQYSRRVWGISPSRLSIRLASSKLHKLNLKDVLIKLLGGKGQEQATYWEDFLYPEEGMGVVFDTMAARIEEDGGEVWRNSYPVGVKTKGGRVTEVTVNREGDEISVPCAGAISTIPLNDLGIVLRKHLSHQAFQSAENLRNRALILINLIINIPRVSDAHWVYLLDPQFKCNRFCEQKNLLDDKKPHLKTLITFELCCAFRGSLWRSEAEELRRLALEDIADISIIDGRRAGDCVIRKVKDAYPIYDLDFERNLDGLLGDLSRLENFYTAGRQGLFLNTDMHDSMKSGLEAARALEEGKSPSRFYADVTPHLQIEPR